MTPVTVLWRRVLVASALFLAVFLGLAGMLACGTAPRPSFLLIVLDDARADGIDRMPVVQSRLVEQGIDFADAFTPNSLCCPSRASILTGLYAVNHRVRHVAGPIGGAHVFRETGADQETIATWLRAAGYRTGLFGKYLNGYSIEGEGQAGPDGRWYVPPGWDRWWAMISTENYGGVHGGTYRVVEEDRQLRTFDDHSSDAQYSTDLSARRLREFVTRAASEGRPFFAYWAPYAPHVGVPGYLPHPAERHMDEFAELPPWRPPNWFESDIEDKPRAVGRVQPLTAMTDVMRIRAYETLLAVDEQIGKTLDLLTDLGLDRHTMVVLTSDNGVGWGEHRTFNMNKACPYEECQRVPLVVRYPGLIDAARVVRETAALNIDLAPTIAELAGVPLPVAVDGSSLAGWLGAPGHRVERGDYLLEMWRGVRDDRLAFSGRPSDGDRVRLFFGDPTAEPRASQLFEFDADGQVSVDAIAVAMASTAVATMASLGSMVRSRVPGVSTELTEKRLSVLDLSPERFGV